MVMDAYPPIVDKQSVLQSKSKVSERSGLVLKDNGMIIAVMEYNITSAYIKFWGVHPQYRNIGIEEVFLQALSDRYLPDAETITISTYRENDKADTGHRDMLIRLGFEPDKLMEEYGYPKQILVYKPK